MGVIWVAVLVIALRSCTAAPAGIKYDQRQEGDVNIRADLENFVILIIPTSNTGNNLGLLDLLSKSLSNKGHFKHNKHENKQHAPIAQTQETAQHFIESKTAPYHVDISRTRSHLAKLRPPQIASNSEVLIAHSPTITLAKNQENSVTAGDELETPIDDVENKSAVSFSRSTRNVKVQPDEDFETLIVSPNFIVKPKSTENKKNEHNKNRLSENLTLLGAEMDQCGPDQKRDSMGICQLVKE